MLVKFCDSNINIAFGGKSFKPSDNFEQDLVVMDKKKIHTAKLAA